MAYHMGMLFVVRHVMEKEMERKRGGVAEKRTMRVGKRGR